MIPETDLCRLASTFAGCDRSTGGHGYTPYYAELFKGKNPKRILEIGIDTGRGLRMWKQYFPSAEIIYGLDLQHSLLFEEEKIKTFQCDVGNLDSLKAAALQVGGNLDIVFDDASHKAADQIRTAQVFVPLLTPRSGLYIIEDVSEPDLVCTLNYVCYVKEFHTRESPLDDDRLVVIRG